MKIAPFPYSVTGELDGNRLAEYGCSARRSNRIERVGRVEVLPQQVGDIGGIGGARFSDRL